MARIGSNSIHSGAKDTVANNEQVQRFVLLVHILKKAGLTDEQVNTCGEKYINTLNSASLDSLTSHLPYVKEVGKNWVPTNEGIAQLSRHRNMPVGIVANALSNAKLQVLNKPEWAHGEDGFLTELLHTLARAATHSEEHTTAWSAKPVCAIWLGIMARIRIALSDKAWTANLSPSTREAYRDGWLGVFGLTQVAELAGVNKKRTGRTSVPSLTRQFSFNPDRPAFPERDLVGNSIAVNKRLRSPKLVQAPPEAPVQPQVPTPAEESSVLTADFFARQIYDEAYLSVVRALPVFANNAARSLQNSKPRTQPFATGSRDGGLEWRKTSTGNSSKGRSEGSRGVNSTKEKMTVDAEGWTVVKGKKAKAF